MQYSPPTQINRPGRFRRRGGFWAIKLLLIAVIALALVSYGLTPWVLHIGDRFTPTSTWDGFGSVHASNGGRYVLYTRLQGGIVSRHCKSLSCDTLHGSAKMCTESGQTYNFNLTGEVHTWWSTDGARTSVELTGGSPKPLPDGWVVALHGKWQGPALVVSSPDNSFTEVFTPRGAIRTTTSTADAGTASVTLRYGSAAEFARACRALAGGSAN